MPSQPEPFVGPHQGQPLLTYGRSLDDADVAMIMIHGRGASAQDILMTAWEINAPEVAYIAPEAAYSTWYPYSFLAPLENNEPSLSSALVRISEVLDTIKAAGIPPERTLILGFSQGACLATEFAARNAQRFGGIVALSGGVIGPQDSPRDYDGDLAGTPYFVGCSDVDPHIPLWRVEESADVMENLGASVDKRIYPGMGHTVNQDELTAVRDMVHAVLANAKG